MLSYVPEVLKFICFLNLMIGIKNYVLKYKSLPVVLISRLLAFLRKKPDGQGEVFDNFP